MKQRWCLLHANGRFRYFEDETLNKECGDVVLSDITDVERTEAKLLVHTPRRIWKFEAENGDEALIWSRQFKKLKRENRDSDHGGVMHEGWLQKQGGSIKTWKKRYCVLYNDGTFKYFTDNTMQQQQKTDQACCDIIDLGPVEDSEGEFWVETANRKWAFKTVNEEDPSIWLAQFRKFRSDDASSPRGCGKPKINTMESTITVTGDSSHNISAIDTSSTRAMVDDMKQLQEKTLKATQSADRLAKSADTFEDMAKQKSAEEKPPSLGFRDTMRGWFSKTLSKSNLGSSPASSPRDTAPDTPKS